MAEKKCSECGKVYDANLQACPECGKIDPDNQVVDAPTPPEETTAPEAATPKVPETPAAASTATESRYYILENGQMTGPWAVSELLGHGLTINSQVWNETMPTWSSAVQIPELAALLGIKPIQPQQPTPQPPQYQQPYQQPPYQQPYQQPPYQQPYQQQPYQQAPYQQQPYQQAPYQQAYQQPQYQRDDTFSAGPSGKSRGAAALLALFLGSLGVHYFYIGKNTAGLIMLLITVLTCGCGGIVTVVLSIISCIKMFTCTTPEFEQNYVYSPTTFPV